MPRLAPTKGNLIAVRHSLEQARTGYDLLDRKRTILTNELMQLLDSVRTLRTELSQTFDAAFAALQRANLTLGYVNDADLVAAVPIETGFSVTFHSVMGVEIPQVQLKESPLVEMPYGLSQSNHFLDEAYLAFQKVKHLTRLLTQVDIGVYRLTEEIRKTQKRSNALKNIIIPEYDDTVLWIEEVLEEREREEFVRLKMIKRTAALS